MTVHTKLNLYSGDGTTMLDRKTTLPTVAEEVWRDDPRDYMAEQGLRDAVNVALVLGQPLLVTGEPGTGKTQLAASIAHGLGLPAPFVFHTKSTSMARDLFYRYDSLRHFHDAQLKGGEVAAEKYLAYEALGLAIQRAMPDAPGGPSRSVVLIDEVDKAPRDLPNDVLHEIEMMSFTVAETGKRFAADRQYKPIVVLTSNSEKMLPDAFLRRCVFYHLSFPTGERLHQIVSRRLGKTSLSPAAMEHAVKHFEQLRELDLRKKPATAELLAWLRIIDRLEIDVANPKPGERETIAMTYTILAKNKEDLALLEERMV